MRTFIGGIPRGASLNEYDVKAASNSTGVDTGTDTPVQQSEKEAADINTIVRRFGITGQMPFGPRGGVYGDFTKVPTDFHSAREILAQAEKDFMQLPAEIREKFGNDAGKLYDFAQGATEEQFFAATSLPEKVVPPSEGEAGSA